MGHFIKARIEHELVKNAANENEERAGDLWNALKNIGSDPVVGSFAEAVRDTLPERFEALVGTDDVAAAYAFGVMWQAYADRLPGSTGKKVGARVLRDLARDAWKTFATKADAAIELEQGFGWDTSAAWSSMQAIETAQGDMGQVERVARLAGRMFAALKGARATKVPGVSGEVYSVEQGRDVARLLPSSMAMLADPDLEVVVMEQLAQKRAPIYAVRGDALRSKGPLIVAIDESGSMIGRRNEWAKAAAFAVTRVATEEKRPVSIVHYSTSTDRQRLQPADAAGVVTMIKKFLNGGTTIGLALDVSLDEAEQLAQKGQPGADIILITDGIDGNEEAQKAAMTKAQAGSVRVWTVAIECDVPETSSIRAKATSYVRLGGEQLVDGKSVCLFSGAL